MKSMAERDKKQLIAVRNANKKRLQTLSKNQNHQVPYLILDLKNIKILQLIKNWKKNWKNY